MSHGWSLTPSTAIWLRRHACDAQVVDHDERADAAAHGHERDVDDGDPGAGDHVVGPDRGVDQLGGEVTHPGQLLALEDAGARRLDGLVRSGRLRNDGSSGRRCGGTTLRRRHRVCASDNSLVAHGFLHS